ncbi:22642_t:CDS:2 [Entrophospora sp. SA101]|nr:22642_t:CDS:2 [Entrophospora sp. SA101]
MFGKEEYNLTLFNVGKEHPYSEYINKLKIPVQPNNGDKSPSFLLHNLPEANNEGIINGGYVNKNYMNMLKEKAMKKLCRSGKTRSLFELLCQVYGIYFTMLAGHDNPGPKDLNVAIHEMGREFQKDDPRANTDMALKVYSLCIGSLPLYTILLRSIEWLYMNNVSVIMSGTGLKVEAIEKSSVILKNEEHCTIDDGIERWLHLTKQYIITSLEKKIEKLKGVTAFAQLSEPLCVMAFIKYMESKDKSYNPLLKEMCHNFQFPSHCGRLFEIFLIKPLTQMFNESILSNNGIVKKAIGIDQCPEVFSYPITIVRPDYKIILCEQGDEDFGLDQFLESPNSTFFVPEDTAGPDLVFIVQFKGPDENYIDVPVFVQAKLSVNIKPAKAIRTTDPNAFYAYQKKENELGYDEPNFTNEPSVNQEKRKKIIEIIDKKFKKARNNGIFWIRILVAYPAKIQQKSYWRSIDNRHTGMHISELMIIIDNDEAKHFFKQEELNILDALKKCKAEYITFKEKTV